LRRSSGECGISPAFDHDVDAPKGLHGGVDQSLDLVVARDVGCHGDCPGAAAGEFIGQCLNAIDASRTQHNACTLCAEMPGARFTEPAARARDHDDFSFDVVAHGFNSLLDRTWVTGP
jgi:hypothetical protein